MDFGKVPSHGLRANHCRATDVEIPDGIGFEFLPGRFVARDLRQARDVFAIGLEPMVPQWLTVASNGAVPRIRK